MCDSKSEWVNVQVCEFVCVGVCGCNSLCKYVTVHERVSQCTLLLGKKGVERFQLKGVLSEEAIIT